MDDYVVRIRDDFVRDDGHQVEVVTDHYLSSEFTCPECGKLAVLAGPGFHVCLICHSCWELISRGVAVQGRACYLLRRARFHRTATGWSTRTPDTRVFTRETTFADRTGLVEPEAAVGKAMG
jgi:hypothetical protein